ncbi:MAG: SAM-dependent DNA methyltransferase [Nitratireductor sp.]|nr:SAM-dependent DNA methyltransferase [Nitratireductor sp.]
MLRIDSTSRFFAGLGELEMDNRIRPLLNRYADFDFRIDTTEWTFRFSRVAQTAGTMATVEDIKNSRGEENIFIWCFFLAIAQLALDEAEAFKWVYYVYIDDPISSLDESNAVMVAHHLAQMLMDAPSRIRVVVSSHHALFINAAEHFAKGKRQNQLTEDHIAKITDTYQFRKEEERYSRRVSMDRIAEEGFSLNISRYISTAVGEEEIDLAATNKDLVEIETRIQEATEKHNTCLRELGLSALPGSN